MPDQESEKLKRLRERQLTDRDPLVKERTFQRATAVKEKRMRKRFSLIKEWAAVPHIIKVPLYCLILSVIIMVALPALFDSPYTRYIGIGITVILLIVGAISGYIMDYNDKIEDQLK